MLANSPPRHRRNWRVVGGDGLIGMNVFSNLLVTLDYPMRKIILGPLPPRPHDRYIAPEMADWTKVYRVGHHLLIPAALNQSVLKLFILDTGAFSTTISPEAAREVTKVHSNYDMNVRGLSGKVNKVYSTGQMTFDFANLRQPATEVVSFDMSNISKHTGLEISGFLGITTLGQLRVKIDYRDALVKFDYDPKRGHRSVF